MQKKGISPRGADPHPGRGNNTFFVTLARQMKIFVGAHNGGYLLCLGARFGAPEAVAIVSEA